jgi:hypothetical protein
MSLAICWNAKVIKNSNLVFTFSKEDLDATASMTDLQ